MRIISQDGMIDVNYDLGNLSIAKGADDSVAQRSIYFYSCSSAKGTKLAQYSSQEKAIKAMGMLREAYAELPMIIQNLDITPDVAEILKKWKKMGISIRTNEDKQQKIECVNNGCFQFPQDSEIEV